MQLPAPYLVDTPDRDPGARHVVAILPTLNPYGGVISVVNLLEQLRRKGHRYTLASLSHISQDVVHPRSEPLYVANRSRLGHVLPPTADVIFATSWETVQPAVELARRCPDATVWYFVQDIDLDLYDDRQRILDTYELIPNRVVKTGHLQRQLEDLGFSSHKIRPGMNLDVFYPRDVPSHAPRVLGLTRPGPNDHRGFEIVRETFQRLHAARPDVELHVFGTDQQPDLGVPVVDHGRVAPKALPQLYSDADVFVELSRTHGFGRAAVEAMACGTACVLSRSGGPDEYARDGENALMVDVADVDGSLAAIDRLLDDEGLRHSLGQAGRETVLAYDDALAAEEMLALWEDDLARIRA